MAGSGESSGSLTSTVSSSMLTTAVGTPLKAMVFVDGTWLYYSFHERGILCPIRKEFGANWQDRYEINWAMVPRIIARAIEEEMRSSLLVDRHVEVTRTVVFTSAKASTPAASRRIQMFRDMQNANMEVHMSTTAGEREKCVDIALAVEMMHYATTPGAYEVAVLVTGDKDFMPAMARTRQVSPVISLNDDPRVRSGRQALRKEGRKTRFASYNRHRMTVLQCTHECIPLCFHSSRLHVSFRDSMS